MQKKQEYEMPLLDVVEFEVGDIITTSSTDNDGDQAEWDLLVSVW